MNKKTNTFKSRVLNASFWSVGGNITTQVIRFATSLIMTRFLVPEAYGLMALAQVFIFGLHFFTDIGFGKNLVQNKRSDPAFTNTVWTMRALHGCIIWMLAILIALVVWQLNRKGIFPANSVYTDSLLPILIVAIGFCSVITGFESTKLMLGVRNLSIKMNISIRIFSQLCGLVTMVIYAYYYRSVWALVLGQIVVSVVQTVCSHQLIKGENNYFHWDNSAVKEVFSFGKWIFFCSILAFIYSASDKLLLAGLVDAKTLGYYAIATLLAFAIKGLITNVMVSVGFPTLSETYRDRPESLKSVFYKLRIPIDIASLLLMGFMFAASTTIVEILYDDRYASAGWMLQIFALIFFELRYKLSGECFMAIGKPKLITYLIMIDIVVLYALGYFFFYLYGIKGIVLAFASSSIATIPFVLYYMHKFGILDVKRELLPLPLIPVGYGLGLLFVWLVNLLNLSFR
jgi:O-antigen/teichoic acid export membrane protein